MNWAETNSEKRSRRRRCISERVLVKATKLVFIPPDANEKDLTVGNDGNRAGVECGLVAIPRRGTGATHLINRCTGGSRTWDLVIASHPFAWHADALGGGRY